jgi:hypothetical protein
MLAIDLSRSRQVQVSPPPSAGTSTCKYLQPATRSAVWPVVRASNLAITQPSCLLAASISLFLSHPHRTIAQRAPRSLIHGSQSAGLHLRACALIIRCLLLLSCAPTRIFFSVPAELGPFSETFESWTSILSHPSLTRRCLSGPAAESTGAWAAIPA